MDLFSHITDVLDCSIISKKRISGGDISDAYLLQTDQGNFFLKTHSAAYAIDMFTQEAKGLDTVRHSGKIAVPKVIQVGQHDESAYFILAFIASKKPTLHDREAFGQQLAQLHDCTAQSFGFEEDNYIGRLPQSNQQHREWADFYWQERLQPQFKLALDNHQMAVGELPSEKDYSRFADTYLGEIRPALLHGDLWGGNYLIASDGTPYLIDPACYYGHSEVDLAMTRLFGSFGDAFYHAYDQISSPQSGRAQRQNLYQLYYLLVHLNLFGSSYKGAVLQKLQQCFG